MPYDFGQVVLRFAAQRAGAKAQRVCGAVVQRDDLFEILRRVRYARQAEDRPGGIVRMAGEAHAARFADRDHRVQEILVIYPQYVRCHAFVAGERLFELRHALGLPAA